MFLKLIYEDGTEKIVLLPPAKSPIKRISFLRPRRREKTLLETTFRGLWLTDTGLFVEVIHSAEAYILQEDGYRLLNATINAAGAVLVDGTNTCKLVESRRGETTKTESGSPWPTVQKSGKLRKGVGTL